MGNASADPHCAGAAVDLARQLAAGGVASLRFDFAGIGDSAAPIGSHVFEKDRSPDITAAIDALVPLGFQEFAVEGLCSGAYHAYHGAVADARIGFVLAINLPFFKWIPGFPVAELNFDMRKPTDFVQMMQTRTFWMSLCNKVWNGDLHIARRFAWLEHRLRRIRWVDRGLRHLPSFERDAIDATDLSKRVKLLFLVSEGDISLEILNREFGPNFRPAGTKIDLVPGLDHSMSKSGMRKVVASHMVSFIEEYLDQVPQVR
jgi:hypothetical protein